MGGGWGWEAGLPKKFTNTVSYVSNNDKITFTTKYIVVLVGIAHTKYHKIRS